MRISVQYSTMIVKSLEESIKFYRDVLGFSEAYHVDFSVGGIIIMKSPEGACVELIEAPKFEVGLYSVGTDVNDLDETIEYLKKMDATYWRTCKYNSWTSSFYKKSKWY